MFNKESLLKAINDRIEKLKEENRSFNEFNIEDIGNDGFLQIMTNECRAEELWLLGIDIEDGKFDI